MKVPGSPSNVVPMVDPTMLAMAHAMMEQERRNQQVAMEDFTKERLIAPSKMPVESVGGGAGLQEPYPSAEEDYSHKYSHGLHNVKEVKEEKEKAIRRAIRSKQTMPAGF